MEPAIDATRKLEIKNCSMDDLDTVLAFYEAAIELQTQKKTVVWPKFERSFVEREIREQRQWKIMVDNEIACNWAITFDDKEIWEEKDDNNSIYIHRFAANPAFRGNRFIDAIVLWAKGYAQSKGRRYIRLDTLGNNTRLIEHYRSAGFNFLGIWKLTHTQNLAAHYQREPNCCFFEIDLNNLNNSHMELTTEIRIRKVSHSRIHEVNFEHLEFGKQISDHMLVCDYFNEQWHEAQIVPFANLSLSPATLAFHYGQTVFEGMKAFRMLDGSANIFRIEKHYDRFVRSLERMCMAVPPKEIFVEGLKQLVNLDKNWIPTQENCALYIRPFVIATEKFLGVRVSTDYRFIVITSPVPSTFAKPIKLKVETDYIRAAPGGTGFAKCGGNYGGAFFPTQLARQQGYDQVLWTDARENKFIEESGMMNIMFVIGDKLITPSLSDTILDGVTRDSLLTLARSLGYTTEERPVSLNELENAFRDNTISEAFGAGTAAVVAPVKTINIHGTDFHLPEYSHENLSAKLKQTLEHMRTGRAEDVYGWNFII